MPARAQSVVAISKVRVGDRYRSEMGDLSDLMESMKQLGLLHPIVVDSKFNLIAGSRRLESAKRLEWKTIPCRIISDFEDAAQVLIAERDENTCRKDFSPREAVALGKALEALERPKAERRKTEGGKRGRQKRAKNAEELAPRESPGATGKASEKVAAAVGTGEQRYRRMKAVVEAAEQDPETFGPIADEMERTGNVAPAYEQVRQIRRDPLAAASDPQPSKAIRYAHEAINCLMKIPKSDPQRKRGFQIVSDFIRHNR